MGRALERMAELQYNMAMVAQRRRGAISSVTDLGELAVRLGSIVSFDRRGDVVFLDSFEDGVVKWKTTAAGVGAAVASDATRARNGAKSAKLTTGSSDPYTAEITHYSPFPLLSKFGVEVHTTISDDLSALYLTLDIFDGSDIIRAQVAYEPSTNKLYYQNSAGAMVELASGVNLYAYDYLFHAFKLVVDGVGEEYVRLIVDGNEYSLADIAVRKAANATDAHLEVTITAVGDSGGNYSIYVDDVIITQNEP
ncbi:MAG: hypothetical protein H8D74_02345 [Chloroflexi bacterium]|nr:hypothetical protein [Chloroflexota bacterium]